MFVNIDNHRVRGRNRVYMVGIELEGGWTHGQLPGDTRVIRDGSVHIEPPVPPRNVEVDPLKYERWLMRETPRQVGEIPSPPLDPAAVPGWLATYYPRFHNATCGMHVHLSFKDAIAYTRLMVPEYQDTVIEYFKRWCGGQPQLFPADHHIWPRLRGENEYCQHKFFPDEQSLQREKDYNHHRHGCRYTAVVYRYKKFGTIECRLLSMMPTHQVAAEAVAYLISITNAFLAATSKSRTREKVNPIWVPTEPVFKENFIECV